MIERFVNNDAGYLAWLARHSSGYVVNLYPHVTWGYLVLHRASCRTVNRRLEPGRTWTSGHGKACSTDRAALEAWTRRERHKPIAPHGVCTGASVPASAAPFRARSHDALGERVGSSRVQRPLAIRPRRALPGSAAELRKARDDYLAAEPRDLFYKVADALIEKAWDDPDVTPSVAESIAVLLMSWNSSYYRFRAAPPDHVDQIEGLVTRNRKILAAYRPRQLQRPSADELKTLERLYSEFEPVLGVVGAAKALHLLAPEFFPIWDRRIAQRYGVKVDRPGSKAAAYAAFTDIVAGECADLRQVVEAQENFLKLLDEFNYVTITLAALREARQRRAKARARRSDLTGA